MVELFVHGPDDRHNVRAHALLRHELLEPLAECELEELIARRRHRVEEDVTHVLPAVARESTVLELLLLVGERLPGLVAERPLDRLGDHVLHKPGRLPSSRASVGHEDAVLGEQVHADVQRVGTGVGALAKALLVAVAQLLEEALKMCEKSADSLGHLLARAAAKHRRAAGDNVDLLAVLVLDLHVGGEQRDLFLGGLVEPEAQDAPALGEADRGNGLAGNGELASHAADHWHRGHHRLDVGHGEAQRFDDVAGDRGRRTAPRKLAPDHDAHLPAMRAELAVEASAGADGVEGLGRHARDR
jgi:hypothetical protein